METVQRERRGERGEHPGRDWMKRTALRRELGEPQETEDREQARRDHHERQVGPGEVPRRQDRGERVRPEEQPSATGAPFSAFGAQARDGCREDLDRAQGHEKRGERAAHQPRVGERAPPESDEQVLGEPRQGCARRGHPARRGQGRQREATRRRAHSSGTPGTSSTSSS